MNYRNHKLYDVFRSMLSRCNNPNYKDYKNYGQRGISVQFADYKDFIDWALLNGYQEGLEIDREDNDGNYSKNNCRFVTKSINNMNRRCTSASGYHGVTLQKQRNLYKARVGNKTIGYAKTAIEAAYMYDLYIRLHNLQNKRNF